MECSSLRQIANVMFYETKQCHILSYGSTDNAIVKFRSTAADQNVRLLPTHARRRLRHRQYCIVNDALIHAMPNVQQTLLKFVNAAQLRLI